MFLLPGNKSSGLLCAAMETDGFQFLKRSDVICQSRGIWNSSRQDIYAVTPPLVFPFNWKKPQPLLFFLIFFNPPTLRALSLFNGPLQKSIYRFCKEKSIWHLEEREDRLWCQEVVKQRRRSQNQAPRQKKPLSLEEKSPAFPQRQQIQLL